MGAVCSAISAASCAGQAACCFGSTACSLCCKSCPGCTNSTSTRIVYAVLFLLSSIVAWIMLDDEISHRISKLHASGTIQCPDASDCEKDFGRLAVFRVYFAVSLFFGALALVMLGVKTSRDPRAGLQNGMWGIKLLILGGTMTGAFFIPVNFFVGWTYVGLIAAFAFIVIQMILLVDFAHSWNESWVARVEDGSKCHGVGLLVCSIAMYLMALVATVLMYVYYTQTKGESCDTNKFFISINLIFSVIATIVAINPRVQEAIPTSGILQSGLMSLYTTYLTWSAVSGSTSPCSEYDGNKTATAVVGAIFTFVAVAYSSVMSSSASQMGKLAMPGNQDNSLTTSLLDHDDGDDDDMEGGQRVVDNEQEGVSYSWSFFHLSFMLASFYLMMVVTDWPIIRDSHTADIEVGRGMASSWVKVSSSWLVMLLYIWSLVAPLVLPDRDFS